MSPHITGIDHEPSARATARTVLLSAIAQLDDSDAWQGEDGPFDFYLALSGVTGVTLDLNLDGPIGMLRVTIRETLQLVGPPRSTNGAAC
jgi:hypothetical protein